MAVPCSRRSMWAIHPPVAGAASSPSTASGARSAASLSTDQASAGVASGVGTPASRSRSVRSRISRRARSARSRKAMASMSPPPEASSAKSRSGMRKTAGRGSLDMGGDLRLRVRAGRPRRAHGRARQGNDVRRAVTIRLGHRLGRPDRRGRHHASAVPLPADGRWGAAAPDRPRRSEAAPRGRTGPTPRRRHPRRRTAHGRLRRVAERAAGPRCSPFSHDGTRCLAHVFLPSWPFPALSKTVRSRHSITAGLRRVSVKPPTLRWRGPVRPAGRRRRRRTRRRRTASTTPRDGGGRAR
ncbi:hypothetical protein SVIOM342S_10549 [Streptomyces violaceorubidus]